MHFSTSTSLFVGALALATELASAHVGPAAPAPHRRHAGRMLRRRAAGSEAAAGCATNTDAAAANAAGKGVTSNMNFLDATSNLTANYVDWSSNRQGLKDSSSSDKSRKPLSYDASIGNAIYINNAAPAPVSSSSSSAQPAPSSSAEPSSSSADANSWQVDSSSSWTPESSASWTPETSWTAPSSSESSAAPVATIIAAAGTGTGMSVAKSWTGNDFESWDFFTYSDPTHGNVDYVSLDTAKSQNLAGLDDAGRFKMSVSTGSMVGNNRNSVRISSPTNWKKGQLVVADFAHMPVGCGTWPAFWSIGAKRSWPAGGEIDIMEGVNSVAGNAYTLHTTDGCSLAPSSLASGKALTTDCQYQPGCSFKDQDPTSFGPDFNSAGGGVYASFFDDDGIKIWFWKRSDIPASILSGSPDMSTFGSPKAHFGSSTCNMDTFFDDEQMLIINTTLMGDWAGATFWENGCVGSLIGTLTTASNFNDAYFAINSVKIFQ